MCKCCSSKEDCDDVEELSTLLKIFKYVLTIIISFGCGFLLFANLDTNNQTVIYKDTPDVITQTIESWIEESVTREMTGIVREQNGKEYTSIVYDANGRKRDLPNLKGKQYTRISFDEAKLIIEMEGPYWLDTFNVGDIVTATVTFNYDNKGGRTVEVSDIKKIEEVKE